MIPRLTGSIFAIFVLAGSALAQESGGGAGGAIGQAAPMMSKIKNFFSGIGDPVSTYLLNTMFGPIFAGSTQKTVISVIVGPINLVIVVLAALLIIYNFIWGAASTAHEGEIMGRRTHSFWAPVRMALAAMLLIPLPVVGGYNTGQVLVAWLVKGSTATATYIWQTAAQAITTDGVTITGAVNRGVPLEVAHAAWNMAVCENAIAALYKQAQGAQGGASVWKSRGPFSPLELSAAGFGGDPSSGAGLGVGAGSGQKFFVDVPAAGMPRRLFGVCGAIATPEVPEALIQSTATGGSQGFVSFIKAHEQAVRSLLTAYEQPAANLVKSVLQNKKNDAFFPDVLTKPLEAANGGLSQAIKEILPSAKAQSQAVIDYLSGIGCASPDSEKPLAELSGQCMGRSWLGAGGYYLAMAQASQQNISILMASSSVAGSPSWVQNSTSIYSAKGGGGSTGTDVSERYTQVSAQADLLWNSIFGVSSQQGGSPGPVVGEATQTRNPVTEIIYDNTIGPMKSAAWNELTYFARSMKAAAAFLTSPNANPVVAAATYGQYATLLLSSIIGLLVGIGFVSAGATGLAAMLLLPLAIAGFLGFVVPLLPYIYWNLALASYIVIIAEAVFASAIWAVAHIRAEGEGIAGAAEAGYMILLALTLTPVLMIGGLFVGMAALLVGGTIINLTIGSIMATIPVNIFAFIVGFVFICGSIVYLYWALTEKTFTLVGEFPSKIFRWFGYSEAPLTRGEERDVRIALTSGATKVAGAMVGASMAAGRGLAGVRQTWKNRSRQTPGRGKIEE
jgi:conjugal transfer/type IV secretion protein DotA/TraY